MNQISRVSRQLHRVSVPLFLFVCLFFRSGADDSLRTGFVALKRLIALWICFAINDQ